MKLTILDNGLRVASRPMPGVETVAVGLYAEAGSRHEPARVNGLAHLFEHMVFKGAGGRSAREISEAVEDVGGDLNACDRPRAAPASRASLLAEHLPLGVDLISDLVLPPPFRGEAISSSRRRWCSRSCGEARDTPATSSSTISGPPPSRTSRSAARCSATKRASPRSRWTISTPGGTDHYRAGSLILVAAGKVEHDAARRPRRGARSATCPRARSRRPSRRRFAGGRRAERRKADQAHLAFAYAGAGLARSPTIMPPGSSPTSSAAAPRRGCSRRCARSGGSLIRSGPRLAALSRLRACSISTRPPRGGEAAAAAR